MSDTPSLFSELKRRKVESHIAKTIADTLQMKLSGSKKTPLRRPPQQTTTLMISYHWHGSVTFDARVRPKSWLQDYRGVGLQGLQC
jgi:hypothetical protein